MNKLVYRWTSPQISDEGRKLLDTVINSGQWSYGPIARLVEREISTRLHVNHALLTNSGTSALWILLSMGRQKDKQQAIILPAFGYSAAANIAASLGYEIYVAESCKDAPVVDPQSIERLLDNKVAFVIGINYFGYSVEWDKIPKSKNYKIIEDAAGSFGAQYKDKPSGSNAELSIISFHTSKAVAAGGEGGCILAEDGEIINTAKAIGKNGHIKGYYYSEMAGMNMLMTDVAACFLRDTIEDLPQSSPKRQQIIKTIDGIMQAKGVEAPHFNHSGNGRSQNYQTYATLINNRDFAVELLRLNGIETRPCWPFLITEQPAISESIKKVDGSLSNAKRFASHIINIPVNPKSFDDNWANKLGSILPQAIHPQTIRPSRQRSES
ncbi:MAG TPA: DegT/DnrJ/EryC1/StrS family aminotransferase [Patescibacteria group bacterium]|nr:DegT/DnrJ/EryC1/StrS family aminotransferase [Patescibacteria group bacterium]